MSAPQGDGVDGPGRADSLGDPMGGRPPPRYSPFPLEHYTREIVSRKTGQTLRIGIGTSRLLKADPLAWNLAWLSYNVERSCTNFYPLFLRDVERTANPPLLREWLVLPAPAFVLRFLRIPRAAVRCLPMYKVWGDQWLGRLIMRSRLAQPPTPLDAELDRDDLAIADSTKALLETLSRGDGLGRHLDGRLE